MLLQEHQSRSHRSEDAQEDTCYLQDRSPTIVVVDTNSFLGGEPAGSDDEYITPLTQQLEIPRRIVLAHCGDIRRVDEHRAEHYADQPEDIDQTRYTQLACLTHISADVLKRLFLVVVKVHYVVDDEQQSAGDQPFEYHVLQPPCERRTFLEEQEQRRITKRRKQTTAVSNDGDEEQHGVRFVLTLFDGTQQQTDKQHSCSGCSHERSQKPSDSHDHRVGHRGCFQVTSNTNTTGGDKERHQQQNERHVVVDHLMLDVVRHAVAAKPHSYRHAENQRYIQLVQIVLPPFANMRNERKYGDAKQHHHERD